MVEMCLLLLYSNELKILCYRPGTQIVELIVDICIFIE